MLKKSLILTTLSLTFLCHQSVFAAPETSRLKLEQKLEIYNQKKQNPEHFANLNIIPFGVGSFQQGDLSTGSMLAVTDALGLGLITYGALNTEGQGDSLGWFPHSFIISTVLIASGTLLYFVGRGASLNLVYKYSSEHNTQLRRELGLDASQIPRNPDRNNWSKALFSYSTSF